MDPYVYMHGARRAEQRGAEHCAAESSTFEQLSPPAHSKGLLECNGGAEAGSHSLFERTGDTKADLNSLFEGTGGTGTGQARTAFSSALAAPGRPECAQVAQAAQVAQVAQVL